MANTFKFGNKQWYGKKGSVLAYNDENNNFKPLPFTFTRSSSATRVNKDGLIEVVGSDEPRVDYLNNADGHLLLEPSRTNLVVDSDDMSGWGFSNGAIDLNSGTAPDGSNTAIKLKDDNTGGTSAVRAFETYTVSTSTDYEFSAFMKAGSLNYGVLRTGSFTTPSNGNTVFNLVDGTIHSQHSGHTRASIEDYGNGWYRCSIGFTTDASVSSGTVIVALANNDGNPNLVPIDGTSNILIWGAQFEQGSYATSYIPTSGSSVTRNADAASQDVPTSVINSTQGTMYFEGSSLEPNTGSGYIYFLSLSDGGLNNRFEIRQTAANLQFLWRVAVYQNQITKSGIDITTNFKVAVRYSSTDIVMYYNGEKVGTITSPTLFSANTLDRIAFDEGDGGKDLTGTVKDVRLYDTPLTDSELQALTS